MADTIKVANTAGSGANCRPNIRAERRRAGSYTVGRRIRLTIMFHLLPQKSWREVDKYGSLKGDSSPMPSRARAMAAIAVIATSKKKYICKINMNEIMLGWMYSI